ncbi:hypothetical protein CKO12_07725 [Chromatium okenii]|uniref:hypothetical protein n=1 Tax=Chromatium okenii TaxID=61644 RepID=UPI001902C91A|nr:hypothetical protein [Chromatium okenii]MBK1641760.1 hypothetical protein [Chromatium okenii]
MPNSAALRTTNHTGRLILTPCDATAAPDSAALIAALTHCQCIGAPLSNSMIPEPRKFTIGAQFFTLVSFTGCAVNIATAGSSSFCHVYLPPLTATPILYSGRNTRPPRCPYCRCRVVDWRERFHSAVNSPLLTVQCPQCAMLAPLLQWEWKQHGGCGRRLIVIEEVFPHEATPSDELLAQLRAVSGEPWRYFYMQE